VLGKATRLLLTTGIRLRRCRAAWCRKKAPGRLLLAGCEMVPGSWKVRGEPNNLWAHGDRLLGSSLRNGERLRQTTRAKTIHCRQSM
jgi:hypothetical protein